MNTVTKPSRFANDFGSPMPIKLCSQELWHGMGRCFQPVNIDKNNVNKSGYQVMKYCAGHRIRKNRGRHSMEEPVVPVRNGYTQKESNALKLSMMNNLFGHRFDRRCMVLRNFTEVGYHSAHGRVRMIMGKAELWNCVDCGHVAEDWSYIYSGEYERIATSKQNLGQPYSLDYKQYDPRCRRCHKYHDLERAA